MFSKSLEGLSRSGMRETGDEASTPLSMELPGS